MGPYQPALLHRVPPTTLKDRTIDICIVSNVCLILLDQKQNMVVWDGLNFDVDRPRVHRYLLD